MDYVTEAKRHVGMVMALLEMTNITADVVDHHIHTFTDIFSNGLTDPQGDEMIKYIKAEIAQLSSDHLSISANLLFFGNVSGSPRD